MQAERPGNTIHLMQVRDHAMAVTRARQVLAAALVARDRACSTAHDNGLSWGELAGETGLSHSAVRRAVARGRGSIGESVWPGEGIWLAIDSEGTRIREDAFRVRTLSQGRWLIEVSTPAVADAVPPDGVLDREARDRVSVTERGGVRRGMLPRRLESELSFAPGFSGPILVVAVTFDCDAQQIVHTDLRRDVMCEGDIAALGHEDGDQLLATCADHNSAYHALAAAYVFVQQVTGVDRRNLGAQTIVAEIMAAANVAATMWAHDRGLGLMQDRAGRYGVAEPTLGRHAQVTNPLRRYSNLVNQRMVLAAVDGRPAPYPPEKIARLGRTLGQNSPALAYSTARPSQATRRLAADTISQLTGDRWREALHANTHNGPPSAGIVASLRDRRARGLLSWHDFDLLLHAGDQWQDLRDELLPWMRSERPDIVHELLKNLAMRADVSVEFEFARPQDPIATAACACRVLLNGYATDWSVLDAEPWMDRPVTQTRKGVRHNAAWMAVEALLGWRDYRDIAEDPVFTYPISDLGFDGPPSMFKNLAYRASQANVPPPTFETVDVSPDNGTPLFRCTATGLGHTAVGEGYRRGAATEQAAHALLNVIRTIETAPTPASVLSVGA